MRILAIIGVVAILLTFMLHPVYGQTEFDQVFTWNATRTLAGFNRVDALWYPIPVAFRNVRLQYFEIRVTIDNNGPGPYSFDIYAEFVTPPPTFHTYALFPFVYASPSSILQLVGVDAIPQGLSAQVVFSVDFSRSTFHLGPGANLADASGINYTDNTLAVVIGDAFGTSFGLQGRGSGYITLGPISSIRVKGVSSGVPIPELNTSVVVLTLTILTAVLVVSQMKRTQARSRSHADSIKLLVSGNSLC